MSRLVCYEGRKEEEGCRCVQESERPGSGASPADTKSVNGRLCVATAYT